MPLPSLLLLLTLLRYYFTFQVLLKKKKETTTITMESNQEHENTYNWIYLSWVFFDQTTKWKWYRFSQLDAPISEIYGQTFYAKLHPHFGMLSVFVINNAKACATWALVSPLSSSSPLSVSMWIFFRRTRTYTHTDWTFQC